MAFEMAYDLPLGIDKEIVLVRNDDRHRKVRVLITEFSEQDDTLRFTGHSLGSSYSPIKAAKKDETPVVVQGEFRRTGDNWSGTLEPVKR